MTKVWKAIRRKARQRFKGYPIATVALYGPDDRTASKVAVGIVPGEGADADDLRRWIVDGHDVRTDPLIGAEVVEFMKANNVRSGVMIDRIIGCPHEEGKDYPDGESCPQCPFWKNRDRWTGDLIS